MTRAASHLNVAQPALGLQIRQLEETLGTALLTRHSRGVEPTAAGHLLFERAHQILRLVDETRTEVLALSGPVAETVRLGVTPSIMNMIGYDLLTQARAEIPNIFLSVTDDLGFVLVNSMKRNELDLALIFELEPSPQLLATPVYEEELLFVSSAAGAQTGPITFAEAVSHSLVLHSERDLIRKLIDRHCERKGLKLDLAFEVNSPVAVRAIVMRESVSTIAPFGAVAEDIRAGRLTARRITDPVLTRKLYLVKPANGHAYQQASAIDTFMQRMLAKLASRVGDLMHPTAGSDYGGRPRGSFPYIVKLHEPSSAA